MLNKQQFIKYVINLKALNEKKDTLEEVGLDPYNFYEGVYELVDLVIESNFDELGTDTFYGWLYGGKDTVKDGEDTFVIENINDLWNFLSKHFNHEPTPEIPRIY